ncbi:SDR family oxidoreductase [Dinoroseobacter sp. S375]|uniref:SDR family oxidoreductase n=1 Tax=Dinoroseobacter sp. S375 TaxID=3415136 RepID=UPI003C7CD168
MVAVITGASRGIGLELARQMAARNSRVLGTHRGAAPADLPGVDWHPLDVASPESHAALSQHLDGTAVDLLVCNAGIYLDKFENLAEGYPPAMWAEMFETNVTGVFLSVQSLLPQLQQSGQGKIAIISSQMASHTRAPGRSYIYRASKAAVLNLGRNLATDLEGLGIAVGIYHPGWVQTDMGGPSASLAPAEAASGLMDRFEALSLKTTGCFETWDGHAHPY